MKIRIMDHPVTVFTQADDNAAPITQVMAGQVLEVGGIKARGPKKWVRAALPDGRRGYIPAEASIMPLQRVQLTQDEVLSYAQPSPSAPVVGRYRRGTKFNIGETVTSHGHGWLTIVDADGNEGFIDRTTSIKSLRETTRATGRKIMLLGAIWFVLGVAVTAGSMAIRIGGGFVVASGAMVVGLVQFFKGLYQLLTAPL